MPQSVRRYLPAILALLCLATIFPGLLQSFEDSEIWGITSSRRIFDHPFVSSSAHYKPLFSLIFGSIVHFSSSNWGALVASRWVATCFAAIGLLSFYSLSLKFMKGERRQAVTVLMIAIISTMPLMLIHFAKTRSDSISACLTLLACFLLMHFDKRSTTFRGLIYLAGGLMAILVTPKSIDLVAVLGVLFWIGERDNSSNPKSSVFKCVTWISAPLICVLVFSLLISRSFIVESLVYWYDSYTGVEFTSFRTWISLRRVATTALIPTAILIFGLLIGVFRFRRLEFTEKALLLIGLIVSLFIALHSQKYLFFIASRVPFIVLGALPGIQYAVDFLISRLNLRTGTALLGGVALFFVSLTFSVNRLIQHRGFYLEQQKTAYLSLESYLDRAQVESYWDAIGIFPKKNQIFHYPSPGDRTNEEMLNYVEVSEPALIVRTSKMELLEPFLSLWLRRGYARITQEIYVRVHALEIESNCRYPASKIRQIASDKGFHSEVVLVTRPSEKDIWSRIPFQTTEGHYHPVIDLSKFDDQDIYFNNCGKKRSQYGLTAAGAWEALPVMPFILFFGYDGTL